MLSTEKKILLLTIFVLTLSVLACGGGGEADTPTPPTATPDTGASSAPPAAPIVEGEPTVLGECAVGMTIQLGEGCQFSGLEGRPADLVISVGADGQICREKGSVTMSGFPVHMVRMCADKYEVIDVLEAEISFSPNGDGSWTVKGQQ